MADIWVNILGDASKLKGELDKADSHVSSFSEKIGKIGKIATIAGGAITGAFVLVIKAAAEEDVGIQRLAVSMKNVGLIYEGAGSSLEKWIDSMQQSTAFADDEMREALSGLIVLTGDMTKAQDLLTLSMDLARWKNIDLGTATDIVTKVYAGNMGTLSRYGIVVKEGATATEALVEIQKAAGGQAEVYAETVAGQMKLFSNNIGDVKEAIGGALIPIISNLFEQIMPVIQSTKAWIAENEPLVEIIVKVVAGVGALMVVLGPLLIILPGLVTAFSVIGPAIALIGTIATGPIGLLIIAVTAIIAIWKNWDTIVEFVSGFVENIITFLEELKAMAIQKVTEMIDWIVQKFEDLANLPKKMLEWGKNALSGFSEGIKSKVSDLGDSLKSAANKVKNFFGFESPPKEGPLSGSDKWMPNMMSMFGTGIADNMDSILGPLKYTGEKMEDTIDDTTSAIGDLISDLKSSMISGLSNAFYSVLSGAKTFGEAMKDLWKSMIDVILQQIAKLAASWIINLIFPGAGFLSGILGFNKGGGVGYQFGGEVKKYQSGGLADTVMAKLDIGEYVISKPMTDFIRKFKAIPQNLVESIAGGLPTPVPAFAGGGSVGTPNITAQGFGENKIYVDIHDNKISDDVDIRQLAKTVSDEILRKIELRRRY